MRRAAILTIIGLAAITPTAAPASAETGQSHVNACLRAHGWPYGLRALERVEIRVNHPNGLVRICGAKMS